MKRFWLLTFFLATIVPGIINAQSNKNMRFADIVKVNYAHWTGGNGKELTPEQVDRLLADPRIKGPEAAALAAIHQHFGSGKKKSTVAEQRLLNGEDEKKLQSSFVANANHIAKASHELFASGAPNLTGLHQGSIGDCFVVSAIGCDLAHNPANIRRLLQSRPDGSVEVHFPGHPAPIHLPKMTDGELALGANAQQQGLWVNYLEKAAGIVKEKSPKNKTHDPEAIDAISHGGDATFTIQLLTGKHADSINIHGSGKHALKNPAAEVENVLMMATQRRHLICAGTGGSKIKMPPGIANDHEYAILGYDRGTRMIELWNPWGNKFTPKGKSGLTTGYETEGGRFKVPLHDFIEIWHDIAFQTDKPQIK